MDRQSSSPNPLSDAVTGRLWIILHRQETRFVIAGAWNTLVGYLVFLLFYHLLKDEAGTSFILCAAYAVSLLQAFLVQRYCVFGAEGPIIRQLGRFAAANTVVFVANLITLPLAISHIPAPPPVLQAGFVLLSTVASYIVHKNYSFAR